MNRGILARTGTHCLTLPLLPPNSVRQPVSHYMNAFDAESIMQRACELPNCCRTFNTSGMRAKCNIMVEAFRRSKGRKAAAPAGDTQPMGKLPRPSA